MSTTFQFISVSFGTVTLLCMWHWPLSTARAFCLPKRKHFFVKHLFILPSSVPCNSPFLPICMDLLLPISEIIHCLFCDWLILLSLLSWWLICVEHMPSSPFYNCSSIFIPMNSYVASTTWLSWIMLHWTWVYDHLFQFCLQFFCAFMESGKAGS